MSRPCLAHDAGVGLDDVRQSLEQQGQHLGVDVLQDSTVVEVLLHLGAGLE